MYRSLPLLFFACISLGLHSMAQVYPFVNYTPRDGLVGNKVRFIDQDSKGKLYFGTSNGLSVYDGSRFTNYSTENGLFTNQANGILERGDDSILIILNNHRLQYLQNGKIKDIVLKDSFCPVINQFIRCQNGNEYAIADEGLYQFKKDHFSKILLPGLSEKEIDKNFFHATELDSFLVINTDAYNPAYVSPQLLVIYNYYTGTVYKATDLPDIYYSIKTPGNQLLLATAQGLFSADELVLRKGQLLLSRPLQPYSIPLGIIARRLYFDHQQNLWIATLEGVLKISRDGSVKNFSEQNGLPDNAPACIFQDREGTMWFGSDLTGAAKLVNQSLQFYKEFKPGFFVRDVYTSRNSDSVWLYDQAHRRLLLVNKNITREFGTRDTRKMYLIAAEKGKAFATDGTTIYSLQISNDRYSLSSLHTITGNNETFSCLVMDKEQNPIGVGTSIVAVLPNHKIVQQSLGYYSDKAVLTKDDVLYVITRSMNLYVYKLNPSHPDNYLQLLNHSNWQNQNIEPRSLAVDDAGRLWIGTRQRGLFCYTMKDGQFQLSRQLTVKDGLTDNFVKNLYCDEAGHTWAGTPTGLDKIILTGKDVSIENVTKASNIYPDMSEIEIDRHGMIWAVTSTGLVQVSPSNEQSLPPVPAIIFTKFIAANQELPVSTKGTTLKYFQNNLSFQVAVPSFFDEKKTLFSYKLGQQGSNGGAWTDPTPQADISFLNLSPGSYELKVRSVFSNGKYPPSETSYLFTILTPWWQSWWFRCIEILTAFLVIVFFIRLYYRSKLQQQRISLEKKQAVETERTRIATDMHDDMGAGLSRIKVLSETIKFENQKGIVNPSHLQKISVYSEEMMDKMGEIVWALNQHNDSLNDLLSYTRSYAVDYLTNHGVHCVFHAPAQPEDAFISGEVRRNIFLSVKEVLHNVFKHAEATNVDITVSTGKELSILVHDNGKGIDPGKMRKFGNGLRNIRKRMEEIGGSVEFKNEGGTLVVLRVTIN